MRLTQDQLPVLFADLLTEQFVFALRYRLIALFDLQIPQRLHDFAVPLVNGDLIVAFVNGKELLSRLDEGAGHHVRGDLDDLPGNLRPERHLLGRQDGAHLGDRRRAIVPLDGNDLDEPRLRRWFLAAGARTGLHLVLVRGRGRHDDCGGQQNSDARAGQHTRPPTRLLLFTLLHSVVNCH